MMAHTPTLKQLYGNILQAIRDWKRMLKLFIRYGNIELPFKVASVKNVHLGRNVRVGKGVRLGVVKNCHLYIGDGTWIGRFCQLSGRDYTLRIGKNVLIGEQVYISTTRHAYEDVTKPIIKQGFLPLGDVTIEDECWIGTGTCILPSVTLGKHSIVGANAVVINDIPPYSVAVGNPARVVKKYDFERKKWVRVRSKTSKI